MIIILMFPKYDRCEMVFKTSININIIDFFLVIFSMKIKFLKIIFSMNDKIKFRGNVLGIDGMFFTIVLLACFTNTPVMSNYHNHHRWSTPLSVLSSKYINVFQHTRLCDIKRAVVIADKHNPISEDNLRTILKELRDFSIPFVFMEITNATKKNQISHAVLLNADNQHHRPTTFILMTSQSVNILMEAEHLFHKTLRKTGSIFPHTSRWLVVATSARQRHDIVQQQMNSVLDNVAIVYDDHDTKSENLALKMITLMWRENRTKQPTEVASETIPSKCLLFPNIYFGFNGRSLITLVKPSEYIIIENDTYTGFPKYKGFVPNILDLLQESLNFTCSYTPAANEKQIDNWSSISEGISEGTADIAASLWLQRGDESSNVSYSFPVTFDRLTGIYRRQTFKIEKSILLVVPFEYKALCLALCIFLYCICLYLFILFIVYPHEVDKDLNKVDSQSAGPNPDDERTFTPQRLFIQITHVVVALTLSIVGQDCFPRPKLMSSRLILFLMLSSSVTLYAFYSGILTANNISIPKPAIQTFHEMFRKTGYRCRVLWDSDNLNQFAKAKSGLDLKLNKTCQDFPSESVRTTLLDTLNTLESKMILISYNSYFKEALKTVSNPKDYIIMRETLWSGDEAFIFPAGSEISILFSQNIIHYHSAGLIQRAFDIHSNSVVNEGKKIGLELDGQNVEMTLRDLKWVAVVIAILTVISFIVLVVEWIVAWIKKHHNWHR